MRTRIITILVSVLLVLSLVSTALAASNALVNNPDPEDRLNLRTKPSADAPSLGKYYNGVDVTLLGPEENGWYKVKFGTLTGYMQAKFLETDPNKGVHTAFPSFKVNNTPGTGLNLRESQSTKSKSLGFYANGEAGWVLGVGETWCHVLIGADEVGFMLREKLSPVPEYQKGDKSTGSGSQTNNDFIVVNNPDPTDRLNLRTKPSEDAPTLGKYYNGTFVEALSGEKDGWIKVRIFSLEGYMKAKFLVTQDQIPIGAATVPTCTIDTVDGTGLTLYKTQDLTKNTSLGLYPYGQTVRVFGVSETWCHVQTEDGKTGFMLRENLSPVLEYDKSK